MREKLDCSYEYQKQRYIQEGGSFQDFIEIIRIWNSHRPLFRVLEGLSESQRDGEAVIELNLVEQVKIQLK